MSGIETVGLVLGAFPLAVSAMEHFQDTKKAAGTFWSVKRAFRKDFRNVQFCQIMFALHLEELLQPLAAIDIDGDPNKCAELLKDPGGPLWKSAEVEDALTKRLRNRYKPYKDVMDELQLLMVELARETKVDDSQFQRLLDAQKPSQPQTQLMQKANAMVKNTTFQGRRLMYSLSITSREGLLREVEAYIGRLRDLLAAFDRMSKASSESHTVRSQPVSEIVLHFWQHAERIYRLLRKSISCNCRSMHCARLWLKHHIDTQASLNVVVLFDKNNQRHSSPWTEQALQVRDITAFTSSSSAASQNAPSIVVHSSQAKPQKVSFSNVGSSTNSQPDLVIVGLCKTLSTCSNKRVCLGALTDEHDCVQYHVFTEQQTDSGRLEILTTSDLLRSAVRYEPPFYRTHRYGLALKLANSQLEYHSTPWMRGSWTLGDVRFIKRQIIDGGIDYNMPYLLCDFEQEPVARSPQRSRDESFWTLGVVLLELCFGAPLEEHRLFADPNFARNPKDPFQRQAVAHDWANDVELEADADYACAVKWCLQQPPVTVNNIDWRKDFAQKVVQPLQWCCDSLKSPGIAHT